MMIASLQSRLFSLFIAKQVGRFSSSSATSAVDDKQYQELCGKFQAEWQKMAVETESKQKLALDAEMTPAQQKHVEHIADAYLSLNVMEMRYLNHIAKERIMKTTGLSSLKINTDWPSIKQLDNGMWPSASSDWALQQEAIAKLWPSGQAGLAQLFGGMMGGNSSGSGSSQSAAPAEVVAAPVIEAPKEKLNFDVELSAIEPTQKIKIIKEVRTLFNLGLKEAKDMVEKTPCILKAACKKSEAEELKEKLVAIGCTINLI